MRSRAHFGCFAGALALISLVAACGGGGSAPKLLVYPGGSAGFGAPATYAVPNSVGDPLLLLAAGDYNGDGKADVVAMTNSGFLAFPQGPGGSARRSHWPAGSPWPPGPARWRFAISTATVASTS